MYKSGKILIGLSVFLLLGIGLFFIISLFFINKPADSRAIINGYTLHLEIADNPLVQIKGLSGRQSMSDDYGMLFVFPQESRQIFWMKGMLVPIDIIWIKESEIIGIENNVQPEPGVPDDQLKKYISPGLVDKVLEVKGGLANEKGWQAGDRILFKLNFANINTGP